MNFYPPKVHERLRSSRNTGTLRQANAVGTAASFACGSFVRFHLEIDNVSKVIRRVKFNSNGCGYAIAAADEAADWLCGRELTDLHGLLNTETEWISFEMLSVFPGARIQCAEIVLSAIKAALANYRTYLLEEFSGDKVLLCTCFGVAAETVEEYIDNKATVSVEDVTEACRAGGGCGACRMLIQEMIDTNSFETAL